MTTPRLLGIDGGGTVTTAWVADRDGTVLGRGRSGPSNIKAVGPEAAGTALDASIRAAFADAGAEVGPVDVSCFGLAGFDRLEDRAWLERWASGSFWARRLVLVNDGDLVVAAGTPDGWGVGVIAGTGSIAVGLGPDGRKGRAGGWGHVFGDEGSGYGVAVAALRLLARREDGRDPPRGPADPLAQHICRSLGIVDVRDLVRTIYGAGFDRARVAGLASAVVAASAEDPSLVRDLIEPAGLALGEQVIAVARSIGRHGGALPVAMAGGFLLNCTPAEAALIATVDRAGYRVEPSHVPSPVDGALILARKGLPI